MIDWIAVASECCNGPTGDHDGVDNGATDGDDDDDHDSHINSSSQTVDSMYWKLTLFHFH